MIEKLEKIILHFEDLEKQMTDPNLINDQNKYKDITKEHRRLTPVVEKSRDYISIYNQITEDESILEGDDEELKKIVKDELEDLKNQATRNLSMVVILDKVIEDEKLELGETEIKYIDEHMSTHNDNEVDNASHRLNLESESLRNKAMLHVLQQGISVDKNGEKVYLQDVYNQDIGTGEEE